MIQINTNSQVLLHPNTQTQRSLTFLRLRAATGLSVARPPTTTISSTSSTAIPSSTFAGRLSTATRRLPTAAAARQLSAVRPTIDRWLFATTTTAVRCPGGSGFWKLPQSKMDGEAPKHEFHSQCPTRSRRHDQIQARSHDSYVVVRPTPRENQGFHEETLHRRQHGRIDVYGPRPRCPGSDTVR